MYRYPTCLHPRTVQFSCSRLICIKSILVGVKVFDFQIKQRQATMIIIGDRLALLVFQNRIITSHIIQVKACIQRATGAIDFNDIYGNYDACTCFCQLELVPCIVCSLLYRSDSLVCVDIIIFPTSFCRNYQRLEDALLTLDLLDDARKNVEKYYIA